MSGAERLRTLAMTVCASRLDSSVGADEFTEHVEQLIDCAREEGKQLGRISGSIERLSGTASSDGAEAPEARPGSPAPIVGRGRLSYDDKVRMRERYATALEGRQRAPNGFLEQLATEYGVSVATVKETVYRGDGT